LTLLKIYQIPGGEYFAFINQDVLLLSYLSIVKIICIKEKTVCTLLQIIYKKDKMV